jgi:NADH-quinone oxidoreductase subunit G/[NiFe] hydrogenase diaphorase moiety small subunit
MIREAAALPDQPPCGFDEPFGDASGSGIIFGALAGVMESALRTLIEVVTGEKVETLFEHADIIPVRGFEECRLAEIRIPDRVGPVPPLLGHIARDWEWLAGVTLRVGVAHGTANARKVMENIKAGANSAPAISSSSGLSRRLPGRRGTAHAGQCPVREARARAIYAEDTAYGDGGQSPQAPREPGGAARL